MTKEVKKHIWFHHLLCFDSFEIKYIAKEVLNKIKDKSTHSIFRIQDDDSVICGFYCIAFIEYMFAEKTLLDYAILFLLNNYRKNDKIRYSIVRINISSLKFRLKE